MLIRFKNPNPYERYVVFILKLYIVIGIDFGYFRSNSTYKNYLILVPRAIQCTLMFFYASTGTTSLALAVQLSFVVTHILYALVFTKITMSSTEDTMMDFRKRLKQIDAQLQMDSAMAAVDRRFLAAVEKARRPVKMTRLVFYCWDLDNRCRLTYFSIMTYQVTTYAVETVMILYVYLFVSMYFRMDMLTRNVERDKGNDYTLKYARLYRFIARVSEKYKRVFDIVYLVSLLCMVLNVMVGIYRLCIERQYRDVRTQMIKDLFKVFQALNSVGLVAAPALCAGKLTAQVDKLKVILHTKTLTEKDPRVKDWWLMTSPWPLASIIILYLALVKVLLPAYMRDKRPADLRTIIKWYNVVQIVANAVVTWGIMTSGWTTTYHFGCMLPDYSMNPEAVRMLRFLWWTIVLKLLELLETIFFVLRKKQRQASFLHVWHHVSTLIMIWAGVKYVGGGITSFSPMINNAVHVIMYSYYLLSAEGSPAVKAFLAKYKLWLTVLQMVQFTIMLIYSCQVFLPSCPAPHGVATMYFPNVIFVYYMFYDFFKQNYSKKCENGNGVKIE